MTENEMVGWHHQFNGHESEQTLRDSEEQRSLACSNPWGCRVRHNLATEQQQNLGKNHNVNNFLENLLCYFQTFHTKGKRKLSL